MFIFIGKPVLLKTFNIMAESLTGVHSLDRIVHAVKNNLEAGLKTTANYTFSLEQLEEIIIAERNFLIKQMELQGMAVDYTEMLQEINCIELDCESLDLCCDHKTRNTTLHFKLPKYNVVDYIGLTNQDFPFKVYNNIGSKYNKYRVSSLAKRPYVQIRNFGGQVHGFLFNAPTPNLKYISARLVLDNPLSVNEYSCCVLDRENDRFPIPDHMVTQIIDGITQKWANYMYKFTGINFANIQNAK